VGAWLAFSKLLARSLQQGEGEKKRTFEEAVKEPTYLEVSTMYIAMRCAMLALHMEYQLTMSLSLIDNFGFRLAATPAEPTATIESRSAKDPMSEYNGLSFSR
jgi:hypothetical protein